MIALMLELNQDIKQPDKVEMTCMTIAIGNKKPEPIEIQVVNELNAAFQIIANKYKADGVHMNIIVNEFNYKR